MRETLAVAGSASELVGLLQVVKALSEEAGGSKECVELLLSSKDLVNAAGGHEQVLAGTNAMHMMPKLTPRVEACSTGSHGVDLAVWATCSDQSCLKTHTQPSNHDCSL